ncbi:MAG: hypothetical protein AAGD47_15275 [Pseudomonadota bacterium]
MKKACIILATGLAAACNSTPEPGVSTSVVAPVSYDTAMHDGMSCAQLAEERLWVASVLYKDDTARAVGGGAAATVLEYEEAALDLSDQDVAQIKGYLMTIDTSMLRKGCKLS